MFNEVDHNVGDVVYFYLSDHKGEKTEGKVVDIYEYEWHTGSPIKHYIIEIETYIDPYLVIRPHFSVWNKP